MRTLAFLLLAFMALTIQTHAQDWSDFATVSMTNPTTPKLSANRLCYTDGRDLLCDGAAGLLVTSGTIAITGISATNVSVTLQHYTAQPFVAMAGGGGNYIVSGSTSVSASNAGNGSINFATGSGLAMTISGSSVGFGTPNPLSNALINIAFNGFSVQGMVMRDTGGNTAGNYIYFQNSAGTVIGSIGENGSTATIYNTASDRRLKENITDTTRGLAKLEQIQVQDFNFIADPSKTRVQGFIAQDLYKIYPEAVSIGGDNPKTEPWAVDYGRLAPLLVKSMQELKADNDNLRAENQSLRADFNALNERLNKLEANSR